MGSVENKKCGITFSGDEMKSVVVKSGKMVNLAKFKWNTLTAADQYEVRAAFDAMSDADVKAILSGKAATKTR